MALLGFFHRDLLNSYKLISIAFFHGWELIPQWWCRGTTRDTRLTEWSHGEENEEEGRRRKQPSEKPLRHGWDLNPQTLSLEPSTQFIRLWRSVFYCYLILEDINLILQGLPPLVTAVPDPDPQHWTPEQGPLGVEVDWIRSSIGTSLSVSSGFRGSAFDSVEARSGFDSSATLLLRFGVTIRPLWRRENSRWLTISAMLVVTNEKIWKKFRFDSEEVTNEDTCSNKTRASLM